MNELVQIRAIKDKLKLSQKELGTILGVTEGAVSRWFSKDISKRRKPSGSINRIVDIISYILK